MGEEESTSLASLPLLGVKPLEEAPWDLKGPKVISLKQRYKKSDFQLEQFRPDQTTCNILNSRRESARKGIKALSGILLLRTVGSSFGESQDGLLFVVAVVVYFLFSLSNSIVGDVYHYKRFY